MIEADRAWIDGTQVFYERGGAVFGVPRRLVASVETRSTAETPAEAEVRQAHDRLRAGDAVGAANLARAALTREPRSVPALQALAEAQLALGDALSARETVERALRLDDRNARSRALLGDALLAAGDLPGAEREYRASLALRPDTEVLRKLGEVRPPPAGAAGGAQFRLRYAGGVNEPLGMAVLQMLTEAYLEFARRLGGGLDAPVTVVLESESEFQEAGAPRWAEGLNDGTIRVPTGGLAQLTPRAAAVLRHELAHSFIAARTGGNCPTWLQEGVSQWLEGGDPTREDAGLRDGARARKLLPLLTLEAPFQNLGPAAATRAYAQSLSAVAHILRGWGEAGLTRVLAALGDRLPSEEAFPVALGVSYGELQKAWEDYLRGLR